MPTAYVLLSNGDGSFASTWTSPASGSGSVLTAGVVFVQDVNGDGLGDIVEISAGKTGLTFNGQSASSKLDDAFVASSTVMSDIGQDGRHTTH